MITKLTKKQELQIPKYIDKWISIASRPMDKEKAMEYTKKIYKAMGEKEPLIIIGYSPFNTALLCALFQLLFKGDKKQLGSQLRSQLIVLL